MDLSDRYFHLTSFTYFIRHLCNDINGQGFCCFVFIDQYMHCTNLERVKEKCSEEGLGDDINYDVYLLDKYFVNETLDEMRKGCVQLTDAFSICHLQ